MNSFEIKFFEKYIPEGQNVKAIAHEHWIKIIDKLFLSFGLAVFIPSFLYYYSTRFQELVPFWAFEIYLFIMFFKIIYDIFDWYNDVWIITDKGVVDLDWALFKTDMKTVNYENIEGIEVEQNSIWDKMLNKGDLVIHKIGEDYFILEDAVSPYNTINIIEDTKNKVLEETEEEEDRFDIVMDALSGVVRDYLGKNGLKSKKSPKTHKSTILSIFSLCITIGYVSFSIVAGYVLNYIGLEKLYFGTMTLIVLLFIFSIFKLEYETLQKT